MLKHNENEDTKIKTKKRVLSVDKRFLTDTFLSIYYDFHNGNWKNGMSYFSKHPEKIVIKHTKREYINTLDELEHIKTKHTVKYPLIKITKYITSGYLLTFLYQYINSLSKKWLYLFAFLPGLIVFLSVMIPSYLSDYFDYMNPLAKIKNRIYFEKYLRQCINKIDQSKKNN